MPEDRKNGDAPTEKSAAMDDEVAKAATGRQIVAPQAIRQLLHEGAWLHVKFLEAKRGNAGLFGARPYPIGSANDDAEARKRDGETFVKEITEAVARAASVPTVRIDSLSDVAKLLGAFLLELNEIEQWQAFQNTAESFANFAGCATSAGADLFRPYDASPLVRVVAEILDELQGNEKPNIPFGKFLVGDAVRIIKAVTRWLRSEASRQEGAALTKAADGEQQAPADQTSQAAAPERPAGSQQRPLESTQANADVDLRDYIPAKDCRGAGIDSHKKLLRAIEQNKLRTARPTPKSPHLYVHAGDWHRLLAKLNEPVERALDHAAVADVIEGIAVRKAEIDQKKAKKSPRQ